MKKVIRILASLLIAVGVYAKVGSGLHNLYGIYYYSIAVCITMVISSIFPNIFKMGVQGYRKASIIRKLLPLVYAGLLVYIMKYTNQSVVTAGYVGFLLGNSVVYAIDVMLDTLIKDK